MGVLVGKSVGINDGFEEIKLGDKEAGVVGDRTVLGVGAIEGFTVVTLLSTDVE